jgi:UDP-N-acetylglucosamine--N-acetylmuramyl-(pentapeptide) pyrophosphoryl-undecaprenol N-acetylglucosamine transferase
MYKIGFIGGHFTTAESVIEELLDEKYQLNKNDIVFFGKKFEANSASVEFEEISKLGIKFVSVRANKINRFISLRNFISVLLFPFSIIDSFVILLCNRPKVLIGFGGYIQIPLMLSAKFLGIKIIVHEGTVEAGIANRLISRVADDVLISFDSSKKYFKKYKIVGCPLRRSIIESKKSSGQLPVMLISGGHLGSQKINAVIFPILPELLTKFLVIHQVGSYDFVIANDIRQNLPPNLRIKYVIKKFFSKEEYSKNLVNASILISRSGINTVCEAMYLKIPTIFIPLKFAQKNEQLKNARLAQRLGIAMILEEKDLSSKVLLEKTETIRNLDLSLIDNSVEKENFEKAPARIVKIIYEHFC